MKSIKTKFIKKFGKQLAESLEKAAEKHTNGANSDNKGSDPFKWVLLITIGYQCFEIDGYRKYHGIGKTPTFETLKKWIRENAELGTHDGDCDYLSLFAGVYQDYVKSPKLKIQDSK